MPLHHTAALLTISTPNLDRLMEFYQHLLDQEPVKVLPNVYAEFQLAGVKLGIFQPKNSDKAEAQKREEETRTGSRREEVRTGDRHPPHPLTPSPSHPLTPSGMSLCLEVENLETAIAHLTQLGSPPAEPIITASHGREIYAYDPDGNWLILHQSHPSK